MDMPVYHVREMHAQTRKATSEVLQLLADRGVVVREKAAEGFASLAWDHVLVLIDTVIRRDDLTRAMPVLGPVLQLAEIELGW